VFHAARINSGTVEKPGTAMNGIEGMKGDEQEIPLIPCIPFIALPRC
jgi:hypothetical protein